LMDWIEYLTFDGDSEMANLRKQNGREKPWRIKYVGIGNENWGCGGNMTPEYYADLYKRYQTYVKNYPGSQIIKVACGPGGNNTRWMDVVLSQAGTRIEGIGVHYYVPGGKNRGTATDFTESGWFNLMDKTIQIQVLLRDQIGIMEKYDPKKRIEMYVDEWGTWWDKEPGSKPGFLYQQNTLRDAVSAGIYLNEFNNHADRVKMANIAQTVNVLQAMVLTEGTKMLLTPTYHVFEMYKVHQGGQLLDNDLVCNVYEKDAIKLPSLHVSASRGKDGMIYVSICNLDPTVPAELKCIVDGVKVAKVAGRVLTGETMSAYNTFENLNVVQPADLEGIEMKNGQILVTLPSKSVTMLKISQ